jgi:hypothetical protein
MLLSALHTAVVSAPMKSPEEGQLAVALLVVIALLAAVSFGLAWLVRRLFFSDSPLAKRYFWLVFSSAMTAALFALAVTFYVFIA